MPIKLSDIHCKLEWELSAKCNIVTNTSIEALNRISPNFIWTEESSFLFQSKLLSPDIQKQLTQFNDIPLQGTRNSIDNAASELSDIIMAAAKSSLKIYSTGKNKKRVKNGLIKICIEKGLVFSNMGKYTKNYQKIQLLKISFTSYTVNITNYVSINIGILKYPY